MQSYRDLIVWKKAMDLVEEVYKLTLELPRDEMYGLTSQLRRAAASIPSNTAEGNSRNSTREYKHFLSIALGSQAEVETQLEICARLGYLKREQIKNSIEISTEVGKMINAIIKKLTPNP